MRSLRLLAGLAILVGAISLSCSSNNNGGPTGPTASTLRTPTDLYIVRVAPDSIEIAWKYKEENAHGIRIERSIGNTTSFALRDTVLSSAKSYVDKLQGATGNIYYRVVAYRGTQVSDPTTSVLGIPGTDAPPTVPSAPYPPDPPVDPNVGVPDSVRTLSWTCSDPDAGDQVEYEVIFGRYRNSMRKIATVTVTTVQIPEALVKNAHYFWQVTARDRNGAMRIGPLWGFNTEVERVAVPATSPHEDFFMGTRRHFLPSPDDPHHPPLDPLWHAGNPVRVNRFQIDKYPVTNQQYADFLNLALRMEPAQVWVTGGVVYDGGKVLPYAKTTDASDYSQISYDRDEEIFSVIPGKESFPMIEVTWYGATAYAEFFGRRLPTEAEWEFVARGNSDGPDTTIVLPDTSVVVRFGRMYPWGDTFDPRRCNFAGSGDPYEGQGRVNSSPVGFYDGQSHGGFATLDGSTPEGVFDMAGNVYNWCDDWYAPYVNPHVQPIEGLQKIIRGGSWHKGPSATRSMERSIAAPDKADWSIGFRTAYTLN
jgi:formylglycine-generating enzyme required for sulfatase activity